MLVTTARAGLKHAATAAVRRYGAPQGLDTLGTREKPGNSGIQESIAPPLWACARVAMCTRGPLHAASGLFVQGQAGRGVRLRAIVDHGWSASRRDGIAAIDNLEAVLATSCNTTANRSPLPGLCRIPRTWQGHADSRRSRPVGVPARCDAALVTPTRPRAPAPRQPGLARTRAGHFEQPNQRRAFHRRMDVPAAQSEHQVPAAEISRPRVRLSGDTNGNARRPVRSDEHQQGRGLHTPRRALLCHSR